MLNSSGMTFNFLEGEVLLIDKPLGWTSFDVVNKLRYRIKDYHQVKKVKVGHAGTLDPLATGLLIICTGRKTKSLESYQGQEKEYTGTFELGRETPSYDGETETSREYDISAITKEQLLKTAGTFVGVQQQVPPAYSAKRVKGKRAYEFARKEQEVEIKPVRVNIMEFELTRIEWPQVDFRVVCEKGVYIRSLAHDFGKYLNNGAVLTSLQRTRIGDFYVEEAYNLFDLVKKFDDHKS